MAKHNAQADINKKEKKQLPKPTAAEMDLLSLIWNLGPSTAKQVHEAALETKPDLAYVSVLRMLQVMHSKGQLSRDESQRAHVYAAMHEQSTLQTNLVKELIQKAFSGSAKDLVMAALRSHVSPKEREEIQQFLHGDEK